MSLSCCTHFTNTFMKALKNELRTRALDGGAILLAKALDAESVVHDEEGSLLRLDDGTRVRARFLLDCSGYQSRLVTLDGTHDPGVQVRASYLSG
jgi:hypothetical protein